MAIHRNFIVNIAAGLPYIIVTHSTNSITALYNTSMTRAYLGFLYLAMVLVTLFAIGTLIFVSIQKANALNAIKDPTLQFNLVSGSDVERECRRCIAGPPGPPGTSLPWVYLTFDSCTGTNGNLQVTCNVHDETGIKQINCSVADPAISGGVNVGDCSANTGWHLKCTIPPTPGVFGCTKLN